MKKQNIIKIVILGILSFFLVFFCLMLNEMIAKVKIGTADDFESIPFISQSEAYLFEDIAWESKLKYVVSSKQYPPVINCRFYAKMTEDNFDNFAIKFSSKEDYYLYKYDDEKGNELLEKWQWIQTSSPSKKLEFKKPTSNKGQVLDCSFKKGVKTVIIIAIFDFNSQTGTFNIVTTTRYNNCIWKDMIWQKVATGKEYDSYGRQYQRQDDAYGLNLITTNGN